MTVLQSTLMLTLAMLERATVVVHYDDIAADHVTELPHGAWLLVQFGAHNQQASLGTARAFVSWLAGEQGYADDWVVISKSKQDGGNSEDLWAIREAGLASTVFPPDSKDHWPGWEDSAVPLSAGRLPARSAVTARPARPRRPVLRGFSCKARIEDAGTGRRALPLAEVMWLARGGGPDDGAGPGGGRPGERSPAVRPSPPLWRPAAVAARRPGGRAGSSARRGRGRRPCGSGQHARRSHIPVTGSATAPASLRERNH